MEVIDIIDIEPIYRPAPGDWNAGDATPDEEGVLFALDDLLDIERRKGKSSIEAVMALARFDLVRYSVMDDWRRRIPSARLRTATADFLARWDAVAAKHRVLGHLVPRHKHVEVFPWVACAICGERPESCNPLPDGWRWDSTEPSDSWAWCPEHLV